MGRRGETVVRPAGHQVTDIDNERSADVGRFDPLARTQPHLKPAFVILREQGQRAEIRVWCGAELARAFGRRRITHDPPRDERLMVEGRKEVRRQFERLGKSR